MTAVQAPLRPAYKPFHVTLEAFGTSLQPAHAFNFASLFSPEMWVLITRLVRFGRSAITKAASPVSSHFARHSSNGTRSWSMIGTFAILSGVFGVTTSPRALLRLT